MSTLWELIHKTGFDDVWEYLHKLYILEHGIYDAYKGVYIELCTLKPDENKDNITIYLEKIDDSDEGSTNVFGKIIGSDNTERLNLSYLNWEKWLGFNVDNDVFRRMTNQEIVAHFIYEMTFNGFTQEAIAASLRILEEHISQFERRDYYEERIANNGDMANDTILKDIIEEYIITKSGFLDNLIVDLIKNDRVEEEQLQFIESSIDLQEIRKQVYIFKIRKDLNNGKLLNKDSIQKLFDLKAFNILESALDNKAIPAELLDMFKEPEKGESFRKVRTILFEKAKKLKIILRIDHINNIRKRLKQGERVECPRCGAFLQYYGPGSGYHPGIFCPNKDFTVLEDYR